MESQSSENKAWYINNGVKAQNLSELPRCEAKAKTTGEKCKRAALKGKEVCGIHAGNYTPGAPKGNRFREVHGYYSQKNEEQRSSVKRLLDAYIETLNKMEHIGEYDDEMFC